MKCKNSHHEASQYLRTFNYIKIYNLFTYKRLFSNVILLDVKNKN